MLLLAVRRIGEYVTLLTWFEFHTPRSHADRQDLSNAIATLTELNRGMKEVTEKWNVPSYPFSVSCCGVSVCVCRNLSFLC